MLAWRARSNVRGRSRPHGDWSCRGRHRERAARGRTGFCLPNGKSWLRHAPARLCLGNESDLRLRHRSRRIYDDIALNRPLPAYSTLISRRGCSKGHQRGHFVEPGRPHSLQDQPVHVGLSVSRSSVERRLMADSGPSGFGRFRPIADVGHGLDGATEVGGDPTARNGAVRPIADIHCAGQLRAEGHSKRFDLSFSGCFRNRLGRSQPRRPFTLETQRGGWSRFRLCSAKACPGCRGLGVAGAS